MKEVAYEEMFLNELTHPWYTVTRNMMLNTLKKNIGKNAKILDAGCGTGGTMIRLHKEGFKNVTGIDKNPLALKFCKKRGLIKIKISSIDKIDFPKNSFNAIICMDVLYHVGVNHKKAINEFNRILKPGGLLYMQEPSLNWLRGKHDIAIETGHRFNKKELQDIAESNGFKIIKCTYFNAILLVPLVIKRLLERLFKENNISSEVKPIPTMLKKFFLNILTFEEKISTYTNLPFGLSIICLVRKKQ